MKNSKGNLLCSLVLLVIVLSSVVSCSNGDEHERRVQELFERPELYPHVIAEVRPNPADSTRPSSPICVRIRVGSLLEPGDNLAYVENLDIVLDGEDVQNARITHETIDVGVTLTNEQGEIVAMGPEEDLVCWYDLLSVGKHVVDFRVWTSSGREYNYSWAFEVTD